AKSVIFLFMYGGPSSMDTWDYKPELQKRDGEEIQIEIRRGSIQKQKLLASRRQFKQYGEAGLWGPDCFEHINQHLDKLASVKSLYADTFAHGSAMIQLNSGRIVQGYPSMGSWLNYGLGNENANLPGYVVMLDPRGGPISGAANWSSGYMPAQYEGTIFRSQGTPILDLARPDGTSQPAQRRLLDTLREYTADPQALRPGNSP